MGPYRSSILTFALQLMQNATVRIIAFIDLDMSVFGVLLPIVKLCFIRVWFVCCSLVSRVRFIRMGVYTSRTQVGTRVRHQQPRGAAEAGRQHKQVFAVPGELHQRPRGKSTASWRKGTINRHVYQY